MTALIGLSHGLTVGLVLVLIAVVTIAAGAAGYRWATKNEDRPIERDLTVEAEDDAGRTGRQAR
jgi:hypothetical protein